MREAQFHCHPERDPETIARVVPFCLLCFCFCFCFGHAVAGSMATRGMMLLWILPPSRLSEIRGGMAYLRVEKLIDAVTVCYISRVARTGDLVCNDRGIRFPKESRSSIRTTLHALALLAGCASLRCCLAPRFEAPLRSSSRVPRRGDHGSIVTTHPSKVQYLWSHGTGLLAFETVTLVPLRIASVGGIDFGPSSSLHDQARRTLCSSRQRKISSMVVLVGQNSHNLVGAISHFWRPSPSHERREIGSITREWQQQRRKNGAGQSAARKKYKIARESAYDVRRKERRVLREAGRRVERIVTFLDHVVLPPVCVRLLCAIRLASPPSVRHVPGERLAALALGRSYNMQQPLVTRVYLHEGHAVNRTIPKIGVVLAKFAIYVVLGSAG